MPRTLRARAAVAVCVALVSTTFAFTTASGVGSSIVSDALDYLGSQQIAGTDPSTGSGAWDTNPASPFVTYDAVLAIAEAAQSGSTWDATAAHDAVAEFENGDGESPLPFLDLMAATVTTPGVAGKTAVMLAGPLGLSYIAYDPAEDGSPVNLVDLVGSPQPNGAYDDDLHFNNTLFAALGAQLFTGSIQSSTVSYVGACQQPSGAFAYNCSQSEFDVDLDTTALALQTLVAGGVEPTDPVLVKGLGYLADQLGPEGHWSPYGSASAESSSRAMIAIAAAGFDVDSPCWRNTVAPSRANEAFVSAGDALASLTNVDGSIAGPFSFSPAWSTAQAVAGLLRNWLPTVTASPQNCVVAGPSPTSTTVTPVAGGTVTLSGEGFMPGATLTIQLFSTPVLLATTTADADGNYLIVVTIPPGTSPGSHEIVVSGLGPDGQIRTNTLAIEVQSAPSNTAEPGPVLRFTG